MPGKASRFGDLRSAIERSAAKYPPRWPYTWGRIFRFLDFPADIIYSIAATRTIVLGSEHLEDLPQVVPFGVAGTEDMMPPFLENFRGMRLGGVPVTFRRGPLAVAFGAPLVLGPDEPLEEFTRRLQSVSYDLTWQAEATLALSTRFIRKKR